MKKTAVLVLMTLIILPVFTDELEREKQRSTNFSKDIGTITLTREQFQELLLETKRINEATVKESVSLAVTPLKKEIGCLKEKVKDLTNEEEVLVKLKRKLVFLVVVQGCVITALSIAVVM